MRVTVASSRIFHPHAEVSGVELLPVPGRPATRLAALRVVAGSGVALLIRSPHRLLRLLRGCRKHLSDPVRARRGSMLELVAACLPLARLRPDVVHFEWHSAAVNHLPLYDVWDCPVTTSCRGSDISVYPHIPGQELYASRLPDVFARVSGVHCVCESVMREATAFGLDPAKAVVARPSIDPELFRPEGRRDGPRDGALAVVMVGWLRWEKGYEYALEAVRRLVDDGVPVVLEIVGEVPAEWRNGMDERARILHTVADLGLERHLRLRGRASSGEIAAILRASDVFLHTSLTEGIPVAVTEAMACELPVVVTDCGGLTEAVSDGVEGFVVPPRDPGALSSALEQLWRDPALRRRMGAAGRARVLSQFTLRDEHEVFLKMYRDAIANPQARAAG